MIKIDLSSPLTLADSIMHYVLIATIVLGCIFALIGLIFIIKRVRYSLQVKHNKKERKKLLKEHKALEN